MVKHRRLNLLATTLLAVAGSLGAMPVQAQSASWEETPDRTHLPIRSPEYRGELGSTVATSSPQAFPQSVKAPEGAPNILLILTDDVGFGASSAFGGPIATPTLDSLASEGGRYNQFHTAALCSPTRAALLTGRNPHRVGFGTIAEMASGYPGYTTILPNTASTIGQVLTMNGYASAWFGKNHNTPPWEITPNGPFVRWPTAGLGFDYFYGFMSGATNQFAPELYENTTPLPTPTEPGYILDNDLANRAIGWLQNHQAIAPDQPFFMYYATGTAHSPNHAPREWIEKYKGSFDAGWDGLRQQIFARQKQMGVIPADAKLSERPEEVPAWSSLSDDERKVAARLMEASAGQLSYADNQMGRIVDELKRQGVYDNTLIIYIQGDNGHTSGGGLLGTISDVGLMNGNRPDTAYSLERLDEIGTSPYLQSDLPSGFAWAMDTPFQWYKAVASHLGGMRNNLVISWPGRMKSPGAVRDQFHFVSDIAPTIYEAVGIPAPETVNGVPQMSLDGISMAYSFSQPDAPGKRTEQVFEMVGNRAFYKDGWMASTFPAKASMTSPDVNPDDFRWELYDLHKDYSQAVDIAADHPEKLAEMRAGFDAAARRNNIYPVQSGGLELFINPAHPSGLGGRTSLTYGPDRQRYSDGAFPDIKNKSWQATVHLDLPGEQTNGTLVTHGGRLGGWGLRMADGRPQFIYTIGPKESDRVVISADRALPQGEQTLTVKFDYDGGGMGKGGTVTLESGGQTIAQGHVPRTVILFFQEGASIGRDYGTSLLADYAIPDEYDGTIKRVEFTLERPR